MSLLYLPTRLSALFLALGLRTAPRDRTPLPTLAARRPLRTRTTYRYLLVLELPASPTSTNKPTATSPLPDAITTTAPPLSCPPSSACLPPRTISSSPSMIRPRHAGVRGRRGRHPSQPQPRTCRREVPLRPCLGHPRRSNGSPRAGGPRLAVASGTVRATQGHYPDPALPGHLVRDQAATGRAAAYLADDAADRARRILVVADGAYAKRPLLVVVRRLQLTLVSRLPKNAALWTLPSRKRRKGQRGPLPTYGKQRIRPGPACREPTRLARGECVQYRETEVKRLKTFLATWRPAGGRDPGRAGEGGGRLAGLLLHRPEADVRQRILEAAADRAPWRRRSRTSRRSGERVSSSCGTCGPTWGRST